eukprot:COSAG01_NODE_3437_length_6098_cov_5.799800_1_plen_52_part_10
MMQPHSKAMPSPPLRLASLGGLAANNKRRRDDHIAGLGAAARPPNEPPRARR